MKKLNVLSIIFSILTVIVIPSFASAAIIHSSDLLAGNGNDNGALAGTVTVDDAQVGLGFLLVRYETTGGWLMTETHLDVSNDGAPATRKGNPKIGKFGSDLDHYSGDGTNVWEYTVPTAGLDLSDPLIIAAHAVVIQLGSIDDVLNNFIESLPSLVEFNVTYSVANGPAYFPHVVILEGTTISGDHFGWCVQRANAIENVSSFGNYEGKIYSTFDVDTLVENNVVHNPFNFDLVNWLVNQEYVGKEAVDPLLGNYTYGDVQLAIWSLVDSSSTRWESSLRTYDQNRVAELIALATENGDGYAPSCNGETSIIAVLIEPVDENATAIEGAQNIIVEIEIPGCGEAREETAWAAGTGFPGNSWATFFTVDL